MRLNHLALLHPERLEGAVREELEQIIAALQSASVEGTPDQFFSETACITFRSVNVSISNFQRGSQGGKIIIIFGAIRDAKPAKLRGAESDLGNVMFRMVSCFM